MLASEEKVKRPIVGALKSKERKNKDCAMLA
jgi:hypothetical protein